MIGIVLTVIASSVNIYLSQLIKDFIEIMQEGATSRTSGEVVRIFIILQITRLFFSTHVKKVFSQLSVQVESSLAVKLVEKTLSLSSSERNNIRDSEIYHL